ncbi:MAG: tyrosine--tRNA ligase [Cytophagales bacterium]|nr:tyrosine--tRNA ligase [Cytophagales bacterium]
MYEDSSSFIEGLRRLNMLQDSTPSLEKNLEKGKQRIYVGLDPTADSLHVGHLVSLFFLLRWYHWSERHDVLVVLGGATAMVGDPSGKHSERDLLVSEEVLENTEKMHDQIRGFFSLHGLTGSRIRVINNHEWWKEIGYLDFLRDIGKHFPLGYLLAKDTVRSRQKTGISFTEFSYSLMQAYDFLYLYKHHGVKIQAGGSDQWGNMTAGIDLIRRKEGKEVDALTFPLLTRQNGQKFGKTESGNLWLDGTKTSPYQMFHYVRNIDDEDLKIWQELLALPKKRGEKTNLDEPQPENLNTLKHDLACQVVSHVHGKTIAEGVAAASHLLFSRDGDFSKSGVFDILSKEIPYAECKIQEKDSLWKLISTVLDAPQGDKPFRSGGEARRLIQQGGLSINQVRVASVDDPLPTPYLDEYYLFRKGKKDFFLLKLI